MTKSVSTAGPSPLRTLFGAGTATGLSDAQLLERIAGATRAAGSAEAAFEALMARHGPMVLGVCRRGLNDPRDVEDAFQATFLVLVRKSAGVRVDDSLGRWLYGVARRVTRRARAAAERRRARETPTAPRWEPATPAPDTDRAELLAALDDELGRLPEKYRAAVLLCDLEGLSHSEAARRLRWPVGTVKGRLAQARTLLRGRLTRRGLAPSALLLGTVIDAEARVAVPAALAGRTVRSALNSAIGGTTAATSASAPAIALSRGVMRAMLWTKLKMGALGLLVAFEVLAGAGVLAHAGRDDGSGAPSRGPDASLDAEPTWKHAGDPRPADAVAVVSDVESETKIIALAPNGAKVKRGDLICRLDSSALVRLQSEQVIATSGAEAAYQNARLTREVAEIAVAEYKEGVYKQEIQTVVGEISLAEAERKRAEERLEWSKRMRAKGYLSPDQNVANQIALDRQVFAFEQATTRKEVLEKFTYGKTVKELQGEVEKARADELAKELVWRREKDAQAKIANQIAHCRILAPVSGTLDYARWPVPGVDGKLATAEKGMTVRWAQLLFWIIPSDHGRDRTR